MRVRDLMTSPAIVVSPETPLRDVARLLATRHISGVPVVDRGVAAGVLSASDLIEKERGPDEGSFLSRVLRRRRTAAAYAVTAGEAMSSPPVLVEPWISAYGAAWMMSAHDVNRLPVVEHGKVIGVIARADLVSYFARSDAQIERDIREDVLAALALPDIDVHVERGRVRLAGAVDRTADLDCLTHAVSQVPGVVSTESTVTLRRSTGAVDDRPAIPA